MIVTPIKTKILQPPQDDLFVAIKESNLELKEKDVIVVSSKVVAIHEGRCIPTEGVDKEELIKEEAEVYVKRADSRWRICLKNGTFLAGAGIDESNAKEHYILLPKEPQKSAKTLYDFFRETYGIKQLGVIIADSHSMPLRYGTLGVSLGWWGFDPVQYFTGKPDLFDRPSVFTRINVADSLAVAGVFEMGELAECTPLAIVRDAPHVTFTDRDTSSELIIPPREDIYWPLLKGLYEDE